MSDFLNNLLGRNVSPTFTEIARFPIKVSDDEKDKAHGGINAVVYRLNPPEGQRDRFSAFGHYDVRLQCASDEQYEKLCKTITTKHNLYANREVTIISTPGEAQFADDYVNMIHEKLAKQGYTIPAEAITNAIIEDRPARRAMRQETAVHGR